MNGTEEFGFRSWTDIGRGGGGFITALLISECRADVPWAIVPISRHRHKKIRTFGLGGKLVLHEELTWHVENASSAKTQACDIDLMSRATSAKPGQPRGAADGKE